LIDVREDIEYAMGHVKGVDMLKPTSSFQEWAEQFFDEIKDKTVIFTCRTGARSGQVQNVFKSNGHEKVINHYGGIVSYRGEVEK
jgi:rhodanese-related sulfurtransferase